MKPQLLAPAGNLEKLKWAVQYGADAVYFGTDFGSLRSFAGNFTLEQAEQGLSYLHSKNKAGYITLNIYPFTEELDKIIETAKQLDDIGADAFIVSDIGVLSEIKKLGLKADLHISTQANTTNASAVSAYKQLGAKRVNLARELSVEQIKTIQKQIKNQNIETEVFIHGAVCFSYSGRCAISDYLTGRAANKGQCTHPCRWKYNLVEEKRPNEFMPVFEDDRGLYFFNSKDLAGFEFVPELIEAGVNSFKIEGRMKSVHYIASTVSLYRKIIDGQHISKERALALLGRVKNRGYSAGFLTGSIEPTDYNIDGSSSNSTAVFVGNIIDKDGQKLCYVRNKISAGETLELLTPNGNLSQFTMPAPLIDNTSKEFDTANNPQLLRIDEKLPNYSILRRIAE